MKELSIEEKAKAYDKAIAYAKKLLKTIGNATLGNLVLKNEFENMFPQLKENEDDGIRKEIIEYFKHYSGGDNVSIKFPEWIAWLEKQSEQKPNNKLETKFKVGEWLVHNERKIIVKVVNASPLVYEVVDVLGYHHTITDTAIENNYHLWTIQDAKDGDVLIDKSYIGECVFIFKEARPSDIKTDIKNPLAIIGYCGINHIGFTSQLSGIGFGDTANCTYYPASKEQRALLFQKMKEAGYEWDAERKELRKIEQKSAVWSEEDERMYRGLHNLIYSTPYCDSRKEFSDWFKSLKDRIQPKQEWSEEDEH